MYKHRSKWNARQQQIAIGKRHTHAQRRCPEIPQIDLDPICACLSPLALPLPPGSPASTAPLGLGVRWCSVLHGPAEGHHVGLGVVAAGGRGE